MPKTYAVPSAALAALVGSATGVVVGVAGLAAERAYDSPVWVSVFHRLSPWVAVTLGVGFVFRGQMRTAALAGLVTQLALVAGYYLVGAPMTSRPVDWASLLCYSVLAVVIGPLYGVAGASLAAASSGPRALLLGATTGAFLADGVRVVTSVLAVGQHVAPSLLVGTAFLAGGIGFACRVARSRTERCSVLLVGAAYCGLVVLGLDVVLR